jgi:hypothetical protein
LARATEPTTPLKPAADGSFSLSARAAELEGHAVRLDERAGALEHWASKQDRANWKVNSPQVGDYDVAVTWSVADDDATQGYSIQVNRHATIRAFTVTTGGDFKRDVVGRIMLPAGVSEVTFFPNERTRGGLCRLKQIELVPVADATPTTPQAPVELHVPPGFEATRVAGRPLTSHPMLACFDDRGRLYVAESTGVNADASVLEQSPPHEIRVLEDVDGDGVFDKSTVFADKLTMPQGLVWHELCVVAARFSTPDRR